MSTHSSAPTLLTLADISVLARVQRPVVSMWRKRASPSDHPFPEPVIVDGRQALFDSAAVVDWLEATSRGNNPEARAEVALHAATTLRVEEDAARLDDLSVLLTLKAITGIQAHGLSSLVLADLADDADPFDLFLFTEVDSRGPELRAQAAVADDVASAGFTPAAALEALFRQRQRLDFSAHARTELSGATGERLAALVAAVIKGSETSGLAAPCSGSDLLVPLARSLDAGLLPLLQVPQPRDAVERLELRRLAAAGWELVPGAPEADDEGEKRPTTAVVVLPTPFQPNVTSLEVIETVDNVAMTLGPGDSAVVVAPASALVGSTGDRAAVELRAKLLRTGRVRAILRLPAGGLVAQPRVALGVWLLSAPAPSVRLEDRWVGLADLTREALDGREADDLLTDVLACLGDSSAVRAHAFRFLRLARVPELAASDGSLLYVGRPATGLGRVDLAHSRLRVQLLVEGLAQSAKHDPVTEFQQLEIAAAAGNPALGSAAGRARLWTLGELVTSGMVRVLPGTRMRREHVLQRADALGSVSTVIGPQEVHSGSSGDAVVDRFLFATSYPRAQLTQPGDVIACLTGARGALVDDDGFSVALFPARVLRVDTKAAPWLRPHLLAAAVRAAPLSTPWRVIRVPVVPPHGAPALDHALALLARARLDARRRLEQLDALADALVDGVAARAIDINFPASTPEKD